MELILERIAKRKTYTIGKLSIKTLPQPLPVREGSGQSQTQNPAQELSTPLEWSESNTESSTRTIYAPPSQGGDGGESVFLRHPGTHLARLHPRRPQGKGALGHPRRSLRRGHLMESEV